MHLSIAAVLIEIIEDLWLLFSPFANISYRRRASCKCRLQLTSWLIVIPARQLSNHYPKLFVTGLFLSKS